jgi:hypothetical protein
MGNYKDDGSGATQSISTADKVDISKLDKTAVETAVGSLDLTYDGTEQSVTFSHLYYDASGAAIVTTKSASEPELVLNTDYKIVYNGNRTDAGTRSFSIVGIGNYTGEIAFDYTIGQIEFAGDDGAVALDIDWEKYNAGDKVGSVIITDTANQDTDGNDLVLKAGTDYKDVEVTEKVATDKDGYQDKQISVSVLIKDGNYLCTESGNIKEFGEETGDDDANEYVEQKALKPSIITVASGSAYADGEQQKPKITIKGAGASGADLELTASNSDFVITYGANNTAGTEAGTVTVKGLTNYTGTVTVKFDIAAKALQQGWLVFDQSEYEKDNYSKTAVRVFDGTKELSLGTDFDVTIVKPIEGTTTTDPQVYYAVVGKNNYSGSVYKTFVVTQEADKTTFTANKNITVAVNPASVVFDGTDQKPTVTVTLKGAADTVLKEDIDYEIAWPEDVQSAGPVAFEIKGKGAYTGSTSASFEITKKALGGDTKVTVDRESYNIDTNTANVTVVDDGRTLDESEYSVAFGKEEGTDGKLIVTPVVTGKKNYSGSVTAEDAAFTVNAKVSIATVTVNAPDVVYNGEAQEAVTLTDGDTTLVKGTDYTIEFNTDTTNVGTVVATVTGKGAYSGTRNVTYKITAASINKVTLASSSVTYTGKAQNVAVKSVTDVNGNTVDSDNYTVSYSDDKVNVGTVTVTVTGKGNYTGSKKATYKIKAQSIKDANVKGVPTTAKTYTGKAIKPSITVTVGKKTLSTDDYTVKYSNNKEPGKATITIKGQGNYSGTITKTFKIALAKTTVKTAKSSKAKKATITWSKVTGADGYEVYQATSKSGKYTKVTTIKKGSTVSYTKSSLKSGKTYYYKVRAYRNVDGKKVYGSYSAVKSVKVK